MTMKPPQPNPRFNPDTEAERVNVVRDAIARGPQPSLDDMNKLGLTPGQDVHPEIISLFNDIMRAGTLTGAYRRQQKAAALELECEAKPEMAPFIVHFMDVYSRATSKARQEFTQLAADLADCNNEPPDTAPPAERWRYGAHTSLLRDLKTQRADLAADLCVASWNRGLLSPGAADSYALQNARAAVRYGQGEYIVRMTSRGVCRMSFMKRIAGANQKLEMLALKEKLEARRDAETAAAEMTAELSARSIVSEIALARLEAAIQRPESENPKDGILAAYCVEVWDNLPGPRPGGR